MFKYTDELYTDNKGNIVSARVAGFTEQYTGYFRQVRAVGGFFVEPLPTPKWMPTEAFNRHYTPLRVGLKTTHRDLMAKTVRFFASSVISPSGATISVHLVVRRCVITSKEKTYLVIASPVSPSDFSWIGQQLKIFFLERFNRGETQEMIYIQHSGLTPEATQ